MLTPRQAQFAFVPLMVTLMSAVMSFTITSVHYGFRSGLIDAWLGNWALAFVVALPVAWVVVPTVRAVLAWLTRAEPEPATRRLGEMG
ncbi:MAG TPA: DUF2798 domain-containing protein [Lysobacter sp.]|jgi:hypothetical protein|nr:DUF2798 domain-containing protein [Lysobacter sp.]